MNCPICGKRRGFVVSLFAGSTHPDCARAGAEGERIRRESAQAEEQRRRVQAAGGPASGNREAYASALRSIELGGFKNLNAEVPFRLEAREICCALVFGASRADFHPHLAGRPATALRHSLMSELRSDGLVAKDRGTLYITTRRIYFIGSAGIANRPVRNVMECQAEGDTLHIRFEGKSPAMHFILENTSALQITAATIEKLAALGRSDQSPPIAA